MKKTVVIGASEDPTRYAYKATIALQKNDHEVVPVGTKDGEINGIKIINGQQPIEGVNTVTMYVNPLRQAYWYDYVLSLKPERVIFNPGAENPEFEKLLHQNNIETIEACTLVMLSIGNY